MATTPVYLDRTTPPHITTLVFLAAMSNMTLNMFLPSLPGMAVYFDTEYRVVQLSVTLYLLATGILQIFIGPLSDRYGRRITMLWSLAIFNVMTVGCILSPTIETFLIFRMGQTVVAAGIVLSRAIVRDMVGPEEAASKIGYVTMGMTLVPMVAPMIGGALDSAFDWRASFYLLLICGIGLLAIVWADQGETANARPTSFRAQIAEYPELLRAKRFWGYVACSAFCSGAFFAYLGGAPFVGSVIYGLSPTELGFWFGAPAVGYGLGNFIAGRYSMRMGINRMILVGCSVCTLGLVFPPLLQGSGFDSALTFFPFMVFVGLGNGMTLPNATAGLLSVRPHLAGTASGLGGACMLGGGAVLSAIASSLLGPGSGAWPLMWIMLATSVMSIVSILFVVQRERQLAEH